MSPSSACSQLHSRWMNANDALVLGQQAGFDVRQRRRVAARAHVDPDEAAALVDLVGLGVDLVLEVLVRRHVGHVDAVAVDVEFPAVIDAAEAVFLVAPEEQRGAAVRAAMVHDADAPSLSRKAISCSPSSSRRIGAPSGSSSDDRHAGIQYCRMRSPIGVPGPTRAASRSRSPDQHRFLPPRYDFVC